MSEQAMSERKCLRCSGRMARGTVPEYRDHNFVGSSTWVSDPVGKNEMLFGVVPLPRPRPSGTIVAWRCGACGTLELVVPHVE